MTNPYELVISDGTSNGKGGRGEGGNGEGGSKLPLKLHGNALTKKNYFSIRKNIDIWNGREMAGNVREMAVNVREMVAGGRGK